MYFRILEIETGSQRVALKRATVPHTFKTEREVPGKGVGGDHEVHAAVAVGIQHLNPRTGERKSGRCVAHLQRKRKSTAPDVAPVPDRAIHLKDIRQAVPK